MTSWIAVLSTSDILSNSSIQTTPRSANTIAPASRLLSPKEMINHLMINFTLERFLWKLAENKRREQELIIRGE